MAKHEPHDIESVKAQWTKHADRYDNHYKSFEGAIEHHVDLEILKGHLPENKNARILDAAGGTGRATLPLARMGYHVILCDVAPGMLAVAREKMSNEGVADRVEIVECDITTLPFDDESFDMAVCWDGMSQEAAQEIVRVTRRGGGRVSVFLVNRYGSALTEFLNDPDATLDMLRAQSSRGPRNIDGYAYEPLNMTADEARCFFEGQGIKVREVYGVCGMLKMLMFPEGIRNACEWNERFFAQTAEMLLNLSMEPSVKGLAWHLVLYGERT